MRIKNKKVCEICPCRSFCKKNRSLVSRCKKTVPDSWLKEL